MQKVISPVGTIHVTTVKVVSTDECFNPMDFLTEDLQDNLHETFPSVYACRAWIGDQNCAIASNRFAFFGVSKKDDSVSIWVTPKHVKKTIVPIRDKWLKQIEKNFYSTVSDTFKGCMK